MRARWRLPDTPAKMRSHASSCCHAREITWRGRAPASRPKPARNGGLWTDPGSPGAFSATSCEKSGGMDAACKSAFFRRMSELAFRRCIVGLTDECRTESGAVDESGIHSPRFRAWRGGKRFVAVPDAQYPSRHASHRTALARSATTGGGWCPSRACEKARPWLADKDDLCFAPRCDVENAPCANSCANALRQGRESRCAQSPSTGWQSFAHPVHSCFKRSHSFWPQNAAHVNAS